MNKTKKNEYTFDGEDKLKPYWNKELFWDDLTYEEKQRYYWEYKVVDGVRVFEYGQTTNKLK